jgi:uncharacterized membrane protein YidH (DUF202 family)
MVDTLISNIKNVVLNPIIALLFIVALLVFIWGGVEFIRDAGSETGREKGKQHLLWGVIGMFIMVTFKAIIELIKATIGA